MIIAQSTPNYSHTLTTTDGLLDHFTVIAKIKFKHNPVDSKCNILCHNIDILTFNNETVKSELITNPKVDLSQYHTALKSLLDKQPPSPWISADILLMPKYVAAI